MFKPLRDKILELAITGKLVPQLDSESAVEQIGPAPAKDEEPFALPEKWQWVKCKDLGRIVSGKAISETNKGDQCLGRAISVITPGEISTDSHIAYTRKVLPPDSFLVVKTVPANSLLLVCTGFSIGKCALTDREIAINPQIKALLIDQDEVAASFLLYVLMSPFFKAQIKSVEKRTLTPFINKSDWGKLFVPLPPLEEQRRIVAKLDDIMGNLERMDQAYTDLSGPMLKHFKNLVLQQAISGQLVPQLDSEPSVEQIGPAPAKEDEPFALPKKWKWVRLKSLADHIQYGYTASASDSGEVKLLRITDLHEGKVNWDSVPFCSISSADIAKFKLLPNDIVIARSGATVGKSFKVGQIEHEAVFASYLIRIGLNDKLPVSASYIKTYLDSPTYWYSIFQSARGTAMKNVNAQQLGALLIPLPPLEEQRRIVARIEELFGDVDKLLEWQQFA